MGSNKRLASAQSDSRGKKRRNLEDNEEFHDEELDSRRNITSASSDHSDNDDHIGQPSAMRNITDVNNDSSENAPQELSEKILDWSQADLLQLTKRIEDSIPTEDYSHYALRLKKLNWDSIRFGDHSAEDCKEIWLKIQTHLRRYRFLKEIVDDAKALILNPWSSFSGNPNKISHPDMPKKPLTSFILYSLRNREKIGKKHPELKQNELARFIAEKFKNLSPEKKQKYIDMAENQKKEYEEKLHIFYQNHPEGLANQRKLHNIHNTTKRQSQKNHPDMPKKPLSSYMIFYVKKREHFAKRNPRLKSNELARFIAEKFKNLSPEKKQKYIDMAENQKKEYEEKLHIFYKEHPEVISDQEKANSQSRKTLQKNRDKLKKPMSSYMVFFVYKWEQFYKKYPGLHLKELTKYMAEKYNNLSPKKKQKYIDMAENEKEKHEEKLRIFYEEHPEVMFQLQEDNNKVFGKVGPRKPNRPFKLFYESKFKNKQIQPGFNKATYLKECREEWQKMSEKRKVVWLKQAVLDECRYRVELFKYKAQNPEFLLAEVKPVLSREENKIVERLVTLPDKPPSSGYDLFKSLLLCSAHLKRIAPNKRSAEVQQMWDFLSEECKKKYDNQMEELWKKYYKQYANCIKSLPDGEDEEEFEDYLSGGEDKEEEFEDDLPYRKDKEKCQNDLSETEEGIPRIHAVDKKSKKRKKAKTPAETLTLNTEEAKLSTSFVNHLLNNSLTSDDTESYSQKLPSESNSKKNKKKQKMKKKKNLKELK